MLGIVCERCHSPEVRDIEWEAQNTPKHHGKAQRGKLYRKDSNMALSGNWYRCKVCFHIWLVSMSMWEPRKPDAKKVFGLGFYRVEEEGDTRADTD